MKSSEILVFIVILVILYLLLTPDDDTTEPSIEIRYKCELALRNHQVLPKYILEQCKQLLKEDDDE